MGLCTVVVCVCILDELSVERDLVYVKVVFNCTNWVKSSVMSALRQYWLIYQSSSNLHLPASYFLGSRGKKNANQEAVERCF